MRGNPDNLRQAAARKSAAAQARAENGLREMLRRGQPIAFRGLAQTADVSLDFLYRSAEIRRRVEQLRSQQRNHPPQSATQPPDDSPSSVVRTLTAQLAELKRRTATRSRACGRPSKPPRARTSNCDAASVHGTPPVPRRPDGDLLPKAGLSGAPRPQCPRPARPRRPEMASACSR
ncbi:DUF6262 family protein [Streptomyces iakyrus]|uniref:DUF6262 family protein n=1 Tax=Streptomyces iakyrus TaxID=68219 RepID=UPI0034E085CE